MAAADEDAVLLTGVVLCAAGMLLAEGDAVGLALDEEETADINAEASTAELCPLVFASETAYEKELL